MQRTLSALTFTLLAACAGTPSLSSPSVSPEEFAIIREGEVVEAMLAIDAVSRRGDPAAAAWLLPVMRDTRYGHELRSAAAAALMRLGFPEGQSFCLAVLKANVRQPEPAERMGAGQESKDSDLLHKLPESDRWAFARELAYEAICERLRAAGVKAETYDVNFGAPDLLRATAALRKQLHMLPQLAPSLSAAQLKARLPQSPPLGWPLSEYESWQRIRSELIHGSAFDQDQRRQSTGGKP
ncbi:MAG: hypothetical protein CSA62_06075 [Planctomycetota bacterium]|nr:MAG: hypothetical protein CSA62_06075 [Planctomycetota bacterium]